MTYTIVVALAGIGLALWGVIAPARAPRSLRTHEGPHKGGPPLRAMIDLTRYG